MYCFGGLNFLTLIICIILIPNELNITASKDEIEDLHDKTFSANDF